MASVGQYILPLICLAGAGISAWRRKKRQNLVSDVAQSQASDALDGMSWREFEMLVGEGFRLQGYQVVETGGGGADGGIDLVLTKPGKSGGEKFLVQCKQWRAFKVGVDVVRELYGVMAARGATGGFRGDFGPVHRRGQQLCKRAQRDYGRWAEASRAYPAGEGGSRPPPRRGWPPPTMRSPVWRRSRRRPARCACCPWCGARQSAGRMPAVSLGLHGLPCLPWNAAGGLNQGT